MNDDKLKNLRSISIALDTKYQGPLGLRFGLDALLGLIPVVGDFITSAFSIYIIAQAASLGVGPTTLFRMAINVGIENLIDIIPFVGNLFDFYWKANMRNMALIEAHLKDPVRETIKSRMVVGIICIVMVLALILLSYFAFVIFEALFQFILNLWAERS
jgi:hypothetical protein